MRKFKATVQNIQEKATSDLAQLATRIQQPGMAQLTQDFVMLTATLQKEQTDYDKMEKNLDPTRSKAKSTANTLYKTMQKEIVDETQRHTRTLQQADTATPELAAVIRQTETERHTQEQTKLIEKWDQINQWRDIAGETPLEQPQELTQ